MRLRDATKYVARQLLLVCFLRRTFHMNRRTITFGINSTFRRSAERLQVRLSYKYSPIYIHLSPYIYTYTIHTWNFTLWNNFTKIMLERKRPVKLFTRQFSLHLFDTRVIQTNRFVSWYSGEPRPPFRNVGPTGLFARLTPTFLCTLKSGRKERSLQNIVTQEKSYDLSCSWCWFHMSNSYKLKKLY